MLRNSPSLISTSAYPNITFMKFNSRLSRDKRANEITRLEEATDNGDYEYWLSQEDIADIARIFYHNYRTDNIFSEFEIVGAIENFKHSISRFKVSITNKTRAHFTLIINLGNRHWVTLVLFYHKDKISNVYQGYYIDSKPDVQKEGEAEITSYKNALEENFETIKWLDLSSFAVQQQDGYNCGIWALENARDTNLMLKSHHLLEWLETKLNRPRDRKYFLRKRNIFSERLRHDPIRQARLRSSLTEQSGLKREGLENKQVMEIDVSISQKGFLKRPAEAEASLLFINAKKSKLDSIISIDDEFFFSFYSEMVFNAIRNLEKISRWTTILDLYEHLLIDMSQLTEKKLVDIIKKIQLESVMVEWDKKKLMKQLQNDRKIDKYLYAILYQTDFRLGLISLVTTSLFESLFEKYYTVYKKKEPSYTLEFLQKIQNINIDLSVFEDNSNDKYFLELLNYKYNNLNELDSLDEIKETQLLPKEMQATAQTITEINKLQRGILYLIKNPELRELSKDLINACFESDKAKINHQLNLLQSFIYENTVEKYASLLIFHASFKALVVENEKIYLIDFFEKFKKIIAIEPSQLTNLVNWINDIDEKIEEKLTEIEEMESYHAEEVKYFLLQSELTSLTENLRLSQLLKIAGLSKNIDKELLDFVWTLYAGDLSDSNSLLDSLLEVAFIRNSVEILEWCQTKINDNNKFIKSLYTSWMSGRDWGAGPYVKMLEHEKVKLAFELLKENESTTTLTWVEKNLKESELSAVEFKRRELLFDLAISTSKKEYWKRYLLHLLSYYEKEKVKVKESYVYSRFAAEATIKRNPYALDEFWEEINKIKDTELKDAIQKRLLVDSTWAFHEAVQSGKKELVNFFLSKLTSLPMESVLGHISYKYKLLRGMDSFHPSSQGLITNAIISRNLDVLNLAFDEIEKLIQALQALSESIVEPEAINEIEDSLTDLKQNYYLEKKLDDINTNQVVQPDLVMAFHSAVKAGNEKMVKGLLRAVEAKFASQTLKNLLFAIGKDQKMAIHWVATNGNVGILKILLQASGKFGQQILIDLLLAEDVKGETALHLSAFFGHTEMLTNLLEVAKQADILKRVLLKYDNNGSDPLRLAIMNDDIALVKILLNHVKNNLDHDAQERLFLGFAADGTYEEGATQETILDFAMRSYNKEATNKLLKFAKDNFREDIKQILFFGKNEFEEDTLDLAVKIGNKEAVTQLLEALADNFGSETRDFYVGKAKRLLLDLKTSDGNYKVSVENYKVIEHILSRECYLETSSYSNSDLSEGSYVRKKRDTVGRDCEFSWEDVDEFNEEKEKPRDFSAIKINSDRFLDYIASQSMPEKKLTQLIQLADAVPVAGTSQDQVNRLIKRQKTLIYLNKVSQLSGLTMEGMMAKNLLGNLIKGDYEGVVINLGFIAGGSGFAKVAEVANVKGLKYIFNGQRIVGQALRFSAPFLARGTSVFIAYDLVNQIREYEKGNPNALASIFEDSIFLGVDAAEIGIETAEVFGLLEGVSSVTGPIGQTVVAITFVVTDAISAANYVHKIDKLIHLTGKEKFIAWLLDFLAIPPSEYIQNLIHEKVANDKLVAQAVKFFEQNKRIRKYVFPSARVMTVCKNYRPLCLKKRSLSGILTIDKRCHKEKKECSVKTTIHKDNIILLNEKKIGIKLSRTKPDDLSEASFFCLPADNTDNTDSNRPLSQDATYFCDNAIGIEYPYNRTANDVFISLGDGNDVMFGFINENHYVLLGNGNKTVILQGGINTFILQGNPTGILQADNGSNTLDLGSYAEKSEVICVNSSKIYNCSYSEQDGPNVLKFSGINTILLRKDKQDRVRADCNIHYIDTRGGAKQATDFIFIPNDFSCSYDIKLIVQSYSDILNRHDGPGNFSYIIPTENKGAASVFLPVNNSTARHEFMFPHTLYAISTLTKDNTRLQFSFEKASSNLLNITDDKFIFDIFNLEKVSSNNVFFKLGDNTEIKKVANDNFYALQSTDKPLEDIIKDYPNIANKLKIYIVVTLPLKNETIAIGHGNHDVLYNNPYHKSHLIGNGGENIFFVTSGYEILAEDKLPIPEIILYDINKENLIDTLDLREIRKQLGKDLDLKTKLRTNLADNDILINLFSIDETERVVVTVRLKNALLTNWHKKLHVILNHVPMELEELDLKPLPLQFKQDKDLIVIFPEDVEEKNKLIIAKKSGNYCFARSENNLVITNAFDHNVTNQQRFTLLLSQFYRTPKLESLSIKFADEEIFIKSEMQRINNATTLQEQIAQYKQTIYSTLYNYTTELQRNRRHILKEKEYVVSSATSTTSFISNAIRWLKEKGSTLISIVIPEFKQNFAEKPPIPSNEKWILEPLESGLGHLEKNNRNFTPNYDYNLTGNVYLLKYILHYLGWGSFVNRMNQVEHLQNCANDAMNLLDTEQQQVQTALAKFTTKSTSKREPAMFFQLAVQSSAANDSQTNALQVTYPRITGKK